MKKKSFLFILYIVSNVSLFSQFTLPSLPYSYSALEPYIDSTTMRIHHTAHHAAYINNLNKAIEKLPEWNNKDITFLLKNIKKLPKEIQTSVRNNGGGNYNHSLFWTFLAPAGTTKISAELEKAIIDNFGSVEKFKELFEKEATSRFGSGWVWLIKKSDGKLIIISTPNQDNFLMPFYKLKGKAILALDVWEHAYYLKYQSKRATYVKFFWNVVNWDKVAELYK